jgi:hypothetical protein
MRAKHVFWRWLMIVVCLSTPVVAADDDFSEPEAEDFAYPLPWLKSGPAKDRMNFASHRNQMLKSGWEADPGKALAAARQEYEASRKLCATDPRLDYAYGLILWKHGRHDDAIRQFDTASRLNQKDPPFLPAAQAGAWARLLCDQREPGWERILLVANALATSKGDFPTDVQKQDSALFLGRAAEFLSGPGTTDATATLDRQRADEVASRIPAALQDEFQEGRRQIDKRLEELKELANRPDAEIQDEFRKRQEEVDSKIDAGKATIAQIADSLDVTTKSHRKWTQEQQKKIGLGEQKAANLRSNIAIANRQYQSNLYPEKHYEIREVTKEYEDEKGRTRTEKVNRRVERPETIGEQRAREQRRDAALASGQKLIAELENVTGNIQELKTERAITNKDYVSSLVDLRKSRTMQFRRQRELQTVHRQIEKDFQSLQTLRSQVGVIAPYVPWDPEVEKDALLQSYRISTTGSKP